MYQFIRGILERVQWKIKPYFTCFQAVDYDSLWVMKSILWVMTSILERRNKKFTQIRK